MGWIKRRINKEKSKHEGKLDWSRAAEAKITGTILKEFKKRLDKLGVEMNQDRPHVIGTDLAYFELKFNVLKVKPGEEDEI